MFITCYTLSLRKIRFDFVTESMFILTPDMSPLLTVKNPHLNSEKIIQIIVLHVNYYRT
jgi:hypothetical protein